MDLFGAGLTKIFFNWCVIKLVFKYLYKYLLYLVKRREYENETEPDIEVKVYEAYNSMMKGRQRGTLTRIQSDSFKKTMQAETT